MTLIIDVQSAVEQGSVSVEIAVRLGRPAEAALGNGAAEHTHFLAPLAIVHERDDAFGERLQVVDWLRHGLRRREQHGDSVFVAGDVLLVRASPDEIASIKDEPGLALHAVAKYGEKPADSHKPELLGEEQLVQAVVAPHSEFVGRSVASIDFLRSLGVVVVGLWRKEGWLHGELSEMPLQEGDLLVLWGRQQNFEQLAAHHGFLMLMPFSGQKKTRSRAPLALLIMAGAPGPEVKYLRRWATDAGFAVTTRMSAGGGIAALATDMGPEP
jgi:Trk K+ transport system NAD-binding subunit